MELAEYFSRIWHRKWIVLGVTVLSIALNVGIMLLIPRHYLATSLLESGGIKSYLQQPGTGVVRDARNTIPSAIQPITQTYLTLLKSPVVMDEAKARLKNQVAQSGDADLPESKNETPTSDPKFTVEGRAEFVLNSDSDVVYIDVTSDDPAVAKNAADKLAAVLVEQSRKMDTTEAQGFIDEIQKNQIDPINARLGEIRNETETLKATTGGDAAAIAGRNVRINQLNDEAKTLEDTRKLYTDLISRVNVNLALNVSNLRLLSPAILPSEKQQPDLIKSGLIAAIVGLFIGGMGVAFIDRRSTAVTAEHA
jgi:uncharacterized protein involved in exopolysaccharide biosynthesis